MPRFEKVIVTSWNELATLGDFQPLEPSFIPESLELRQLSFHYLPTGAELPTRRNGVVAAYYYGEPGFMLFQQGWGAGHPIEIPHNEPSGELIVGQYLATWLRGRGVGGVGPPKTNKPDDAFLRVGWRPDPRGESGPGWLIASDCLTLDEVKRVIESFL